MFVSRSSFVPARASASMVPLLLLALGVSSLLHDPQSTFAGDAKQCQTAKIAAHERVHVQPAEIDKRQLAALSGLRADISSLHTELEALRRNGKSLNEQLAASEKNRQLVQRELAVFLKQRNSGPSDVVEVSRQFATAMKQLSETSQARLVEQQKLFDAEAQRYRSENERTRAEVQ